MPSVPPVYIRGPSLDQYINTILPIDYDRQKRPLNPYTIDTITNVSISLFVNELRGVGDVQQNYEIDVTLTLEWYEPRILADQIDRQLTINDEFLIQKFWLPDLFIVNAQSISIIHSVNPIQKLIITERGQIYYVRRLDAQLQCSINLEKYPHDHNYCDIRFSTILHNTSEIFIWIKDFNVYQDEYPHFRVREWYTWDSCASYNYPIQENPCIVGTIKFVRHLSYYVIRYYLLDFLAVWVSFLSFWIPVNMWPARIALTVVPLLNLITQDISVNNEIQCNYVTSFHWWMMWIQGIVWADIAEYATAMAWSHFIADKKNHHKKWKEQQDQIAAGNIATITNPLKPYVDGYYFGNDGWYKKCGEFFDKMLFYFYGEVDYQRDPYVRNKIDYLARIFFPFLFTMFCMIYSLATAAPWAGNYD
uniref:Glutamate-gated chloride channel-like n=1 Tax=Dermatophagoides pteronyssinus TaxID=6956 RepID=A0A6P6YD74_DERPT|nr:glutamate-gated chloride channel-like [Dermatophagoides pteronyssinus]